MNLDQIILITDWDDRWYECEKCHAHIDGLTLAELLNNGSAHECADVTT